jgi:hypothetical protein
MSADAESFFFGTPGQVHSGTGNQFINSMFILDSFPRLGRVGHGPRVVAREQLHRLNQRFVEPGHYGRARDLLANNASVLLTGAPGSGRHAAAKMLLYRLDGKGLQIRELPDADPGDSSGEPVLDASAVDSGQRLLLDLSTRDETYCAVVLGQLPSYRDVVQERGAHLVVALPHSRKHYLGSEFESSIVEIARPNGSEVFRRYLRCDGVTRNAQLDIAELTTLLQSEPMQQIAKLAGLVLLFKESAPTKGFPCWRDEAFTALTQRSGQVAKKVQDLRSGQQPAQRCALLLTTAMFSEAHADAVFASASRLCELVGHTADDRPRLQQEGFAEQLAEIGAETDNAGRVRFTPLAYDQAVRTHFWTNYPDLREDFRNWVRTALGHRTLCSKDRDAVVARFAEQALRTDRPDDLRRLVEHWARRTDVRWPSLLLPQASRAVELGLIHERYGLFFRRQLLTWSRDPRLSSDLAQVVVQVCSEVLGPTHAEQAMVRLHHIVRRHSGAAGAAARAALLNLIGRDRRLYRRLLDRVTNSQRAKGDEAADLALFLDLADPAQLTDSQRRTQPLIVDKTVRGQLVIGWNAVLSGPFSLDCAHPAGTWLAAAHEDGQNRELLLDVLVEAGDGRDDLLSRLHVIARNWAHAPGGDWAQRSGIAAHLNNKIDSAQGIDFTELDLGDRTEGTSP